MSSSMRNLTWRNALVSLICVLGIFAPFVVWGLVMLTDTSLKDAAATVQAVGTVIAIYVGGAFALYRLNIFRSFEPHLTITQEVSHRPISDSYVHIAVTATLHNSSKVRIDLREGFFQLFHLRPLSDEDVEELYDEVFIDERDQYIQWEILDEAPRAWLENELIIEPEGLHQETCDFIVSTEVESVIVYSYFYNSVSNAHTPSSEGWTSTTVYDISDNR